jgi:hypothetical protein
MNQNKISSEYDITDRNGTPNMHLRETSYSQNIDSL